MSNLVKKNGNLFPSALSDFFDTDKFFANPIFEREFGQTLPAVNIKETENSFDIEFAAPGYDKKDFNIRVEDNLLTISAEKKGESNEENKRFTRKEFSYSSFSRSFTLPQSVDSDKIDANYGNGILKLLIPKKEEAKKTAKREIKIA